MAPKTDRRAVDLFCGAGGFSAGLLRAGWEVVLGVDVSPVALAVYQANLRHMAIALDLGAVDDAVELVRAVRPTLVAASPPCQDFSLAGARQEGGRASLTVSWARIIAAVAPPFFLMENVPLTRRAEAYAEARRLLAEAGYQTWERVLDASYCGVPQRRKRLFAFGWRGPDLLGGRVDAWIAGHLAERPLSVRQYLEGAGADWPKHYYAHRPRPGRQEVFGIDEVAPTLNGTNCDPPSPPPPGAEEVNTGFPDHYYAIARNYARRSIFGADEPAPTVRGQKPHMPPSYRRHPKDVVPPHQTRRLTPAERARIQTFPATWDWSSVRTRTALEQLIGNAVPVEMARFIGAAVLSATRC